MIPSILYNVIRHNVIHHLEYSYHSLRSVYIALELQPDLPADPLTFAYALSLAISTYDTAYPPETVPLWAAVFTATAALLVLATALAVVIWSRRTSEAPLLY